MLNKAQIIGHLGKDPKVTINGEFKTANFTVATTDPAFTTESGIKVEERTEWHNVVCYNNLASTVEKYLKKGSKVFIEGKLRMRVYFDKQAIKHQITEISATNLIMLSPKPQQDNNENQPLRAAENIFKPGNDLPY